MKFSHNTTTMLLYTITSITFKFLRFQINNFTSDINCDALHSNKKTLIQKVNTFTDDVILSIMQPNKDMRELKLLNSSHASPNKYMTDTILHHTSKTVPTLAPESCIPSLHIMIPVLKRSSLICSDHPQLPKQQTNIVES